MTPVTELEQFVGLQAPRKPNPSNCLTSLFWSWENSRCLCISCFSLVLKYFRRGRGHATSWKGTCRWSETACATMYDFKRMEQLPHLSNLQKFLIFFHMPEKKRARQGKISRVFAWTWHLGKPEVVLKWENPWKGRDLVYLWLVLCLEQLRQDRADDKLARAWSFPGTPGTEQSPPVSRPAWVTVILCD